MRAIASVLFSAAAVSAAFGQEPSARVTILYDAFGKSSPVKRGWGYSALVEYGGKRILFDTGATSMISHSTPRPSARI